MSITNSQIYNNRITGILFEYSNDNLLVSGNTLFGTPSGLSAMDDQYAGIELRGQNNLVVDNTVFDSTWYGILNRGANSVIEGNSIYNCTKGIDAGGGTSNEDRVVVHNNTVFDNTNVGIEVSARVLVADNLVYGHTAWGAGDCC